MPPLAIPLPDGRPGEAVRTFTGAVMPDGTDAVAMHEFCELDAGGTSVTIGGETGARFQQPAGRRESAQGRDHHRRRHVALPPPISASLGKRQAALTVHRRLKVGLISMGDEVVSPGEQPAHGQLHDSNRPMLADMIEAMDLS